MDKKMNEVTEVKNEGLDTFRSEALENYNATKMLLKTMQRKAIELGYFLNEAHRAEYYRALGYNDIYEYAQSEFGIGKTSTKNYQALNRTFTDSYEDGKYKGYSLNVLAQFKEYNTSQLIEMLPLTPGERSKVTPSMKVSEIRDYKSILEKPGLIGLDEHFYQQIKNDPAAAVKQYRELKAMPKITTKAQDKEIADTLKAIDKLIKPAKNDKTLQSEVVAKGQLFVDDDGEITEFHQAGAEKLSQTSDLKEDYEEIIKPRSAPEVAKEILDKVLEKADDADPKEVFNRTSAVKREETESVDIDIEEDEYDDADPDEFGEPRKVYLSMQKLCEFFTAYMRKNSFSVKQFDATKGFVDVHEDDFIYDISSDVYDYYQYTDDTLDDVCVTDGHNAVVLKTAEIEDCIFKYLKQWVYTIKSQWLGWAEPQPVDNKDAAHFIAHSIYERYKDIFNGRIKEISASSVLHEEKKTVVPQKHSFKNKEERENFLRNEENYPITVLENPELGLKVKRLDFANGTKIYRTEYAYYSDYHKEYSMQVSYCLIDVREAAEKSMQSAMGLRSPKTYTLEGTAMTYMLDYMTKFKDEI